MMRAQARVPCRKLATSYFSSGEWALSSASPKPTKRALAKQLFNLARHGQERGWSAEELLAAEAQREERRLRRLEARRGRTA